MSVVIDIHCWVGENRIWKPHLIAAEIYRHRDQPIILEINDEGYDVTRNGLDDLVKEVCDFYNIPYSNITYTSGDSTQKSKYFKHKYIGYNGDATRLKPHTGWFLPESFNYGLFLVRPTNERLYAFYKHLVGHTRSKGRSTFHFKENINLQDAEFIDFIINHNDKWQRINKQLPYSDYEPSKSVEDYISGDTNNSDFWNTVYNDCAVEIVCETNIKPGSRFITEKTFRPLMYGRLFMVVGSPGYENYLKSLGFDIFDDIIDKTYDLAYSYKRVDEVYIALDKLLNNNLDMVLLKDRLIKNQKRVNEYILEQQHLRKTIGLDLTSPS